MERIAGVRHAWRRILVIGLLYAAVFAVPLPWLRPVLQVDGVFLEGGKAAPRRYPFVLARFSSQITLRVSSGLSGGPMLLRVRCGESWVQYHVSGHTHWSETFGLGNGFPPGTHTVEVEQNGARGRWRVEVIPGSPVTAWQRILALIILGCVIACVAVAAGWGRGTASGVAWRQVRRMFALALLLMAAYPLIHESGHALALIAFGAFRPADSDFLGLGGTPHVGFRNGAVLTGWQRAIVSGAGPLLPSLVGYVLLALWLSRRGRAVRQRLDVLDLCWSVLVVELLFGQVGALLPVLGSSQDGDYNGMVSSGVLPVWAVNAVMCVLVVLNLALLIAPARGAFQLLCVRRKQMATGGSS